MHYQRYRYRGTLDQIAPPLAKACIICGAAFPEVHDSRRIYCSQGCSDKAAGARYRANRKRNVSACQHCGGSLSDKRTDARYCSISCSDSARNARTSELTRANRKPCVHCGEPIPLNANRFCSSTCAIANRRPEKYGMTRDELAALLAQHATCAICGSDRWGKKGPQVDHDHATGKVRGILCVNCNTLLGHVGDDIAHLQAAIAYLTR